MITLGTLFLFFASMGLIFYFVQDWPYISYISTLFYRYYYLCVHTVEDWADDKGLTLKIVSTFCMIVLQVGVWYLGWISFFYIRIPGLIIMTLISSYFTISFLTGTKKYQLFYSQKVNGQSQKHGISMQSVPKIGASFMGSLSMKELKPGEEYMFSEEEGMTYEQYCHRKTHDRTSFPNRRGRSYYLLNVWDYSSFTKACFCYFNPLFLYMMWWYRFKVSMYFFMLSFSLLMDFLLTKMEQKLEDSRIVFQEAAFITHFSNEMWSNARLIAEERVFNRPANKRRVKVYSVEDEPSDPSQPDESDPSSVAAASGSFFRRSMPSRLPESTNNSFPFAPSAPPLDDTPPHRSPPSSPPSVAPDNPFQSARRRRRRH
mmetsp:Transcript_10634/g.15569  ORF Transcript_10634/g.15569 Transcript_10634/m.15569 type:complete len:373 (+) Transcript_10634:33-1151(+)